VATEISFSYRSAREVIELSNTHGPINVGGYLNKDSPTVLEILSFYDKYTDIWFNGYTGQGVFINSIRIEGLPSSEVYNILASYPWITEMEIKKNSEGNFSINIRWF
jgi:hypothetical protein